LSNEPPHPSDARKHLQWLFVMAHRDHLVARKRERERERAKDRERLDRKWKKT
jgi:desulfoferrodoxin (superoxide reductase-like protein)